MNPESYCRQIYCKCISWFVNYDRWAFLRLTNELSTICYDDHLCVFQMRLFDPKFAHWQTSSSRHVTITSSRSLRCNERQTLVNLLSVDITSYFEQNNRDDKVNYDTQPTTWPIDRVDSYQQRIRMIPISCKGEKCTLPISIMDYSGLRLVSPVLPDLPKFYHFGQFFIVFGNLLKVIKHLAKILCYCANFHRCIWPNAEQLI